MTSTQYQPKTGVPCSCRRGQERDNCPQCEGTGMRIDFVAIRARRTEPERLFTLTLFTDDMGSFKQPGCKNKEDALWHINSARDHDGLKHLTMEQLSRLLRGTNWGHAKFTEQ